MNAAKGVFFNAIEIKLGMYVLLVLGINIVHVLFGLRLTNICSCYYISRQ